MFWQSIEHEYHRVSDAAAANFSSLGEIDNTDDDYLRGRLHTLCVTYLRKLFEDSGLKCYI